jgi:hypothetical protein
MQRRYISKKLATPLILEIPKISLERREEEKILREYFDNPPSGPSVIIGLELL